MPNTIVIASNRVSKKVIINRGRTGYLNTTQDYYLEGKISYKIENQIQNLITDDPTLNSPTYLFYTSNNADISPDMRQDVRFVHLENNIGYVSESDSSGSGSSGNYAKTAVVESSYDSETEETTAKLMSGGKGWNIRYDGENTTAELTSDIAPTINSSVILTEENATSGSSLLKGNGTGGITNASAGTDFGQPLVHTGTWATKPAASSYPGRSIRPSDTNNIEFVSDGLQWRAHNGRGILAKSTNVFCLLQTATIATGDSGHITLGSNLLSFVTKLPYVMCYLTETASTPSLTAGLYPIVFSTQSVGTIYTDTTLTTPYNFSDGATMTGVATGVSVVVDSFSLKGGLFYNWSQLNIRVRTRNTSSTNNKIVSITHVGSISGAAQKGTVTYTGGSVAGDTIDFDFCAFNGNLSTGSASAHSGLGPFTNTPASTAVIDLTSDSTISYVLEKATATDYLMLEMSRAEIIQ